MPPDETSVKQAFAAATAAVPALASILAEYGHLSLADYLGRIAQGPAAPPDLRAAVYDHALSLFGPRLARQTAAVLENGAAVLTANHHGVDFFAQSVQGNLILSLNPATRNSAPVLPVLAFANVALSNPTYPRGLLLYDPQAIASDGRPIRCPLFPASERRRPVATAPALTEDRVQAAIDRLDSMKINPAIAATARHLLRSVYLDPACMAQPGYLQQAAHLNRRIWKHLFVDAASAPELICIGVEAVVTRLLVQDLQDSESMAYRCFFDVGLRRALIESLDGVPGCWGSCGQTGDPGGTVFFWALDPKGRIIGLHLKEHGGSGVRLESRQDGGKAFTLAWTPPALTEALCQGRLLPSLYTCFLQIALARALVCLGGYYQRDYLPRMQAGTAAALAAAGDRETARRVEAVATRGYLSGMIGAMIRHGEGLFPAGPVEIIAAGGLRQEDLDRMAALRVQQAHLAGLFDTMADAVAPEARPAGWARSLARTCAAALAHRVVVQTL